MKPNGLENLLRNSGLRDIEPLEHEIQDAEVSVLVFGENFILDLLRKNKPLKFEQIFTEFCNEHAREVEEQNSERDKESIVYKASQDTVRVIRLVARKTADYLVEFWDKIGTSSFFHEFIDFLNEHDDNDAIVDYLNEKGIKTFVEPGRNWIQKYLKPHYSMLAFQLDYLQKQGKIKYEEGFYRLAFLNREFEKKLGIKIKS